MKIWILHIEYDNGENILPCLTEADAKQELLNYVDERWPEGIDEHPDPDKRIEAYFNAGDEDAARIFPVDLVDSKGALDALVESYKRAYTDARAVELDYSDPELIDWKWLRRHRMAVLEDLGIDTDALEPDQTDYGIEAEDD